MAVICLKTAVSLGALLLSATSVSPQIHGVPLDLASGLTKATEATPILSDLRFTGLRRIAPAAVAAQITSHVGDRFDPAKIEKDDRTLARLGWFESIEVEEAPAMTPALPMLENESHA